jgi:aminocarboxymuconate-semialdehyde decarboxylase
MMYTCTPRAHPHATRADMAKAASRKIIKRTTGATKSLAVDLHCHVHVPEADAIAKQTVLPAPDPVVQHGSQRSADRQKEQWQQIHHKATSTEARLAEMNKMGIDVQAISTSPSHYNYRIEPELGRQSSRVVN